MKARALSVLALLAVACGGSAESSCPHRTHEVAEAGGGFTVVDNSAAQDRQICDYLVWLRAHAQDGDAGTSGDSK